MAQIAQYRAAPLNAVNDDADARRFLPPPGIHPNNAVFGGVNLPKPLTWQQREHMVQRRNILGRIGQLLSRNAQLVVGNDGSNTTEAHQRTWALARKLEVLIFLNSASLLEYSNVDSLARRVQALTTSLVNKKIRRDIVDQNATSVTASSAAVAGGSGAAGACGHSTPTPMRCTPSSADSTLMTGVAVSATIRRGVSPDPDMLEEKPSIPSSLPRTSTVAATAVTGPPTARQTTTKRSADEMVGIMAPFRSTESTMGGPGSSQMVKRRRASRSYLLGSLLFRGFEEISSILWSYVDGVQIMRCRAVCRAARVLAPLFVSSLQLSCNGIQRALSTQSSGRGGGSVLRECVNLRHLEIVSLSSGMTFGKLSMRAMNCPQRFVVTHDDHEQIVLALSEQLRYNAFPRLTRLGLTCLFTNEEADGEADVLLNNLMTGCCPQLEELCLPGNSFGDYGAMKVAQMLRSRVCPKLTRLDLRRNFISEEGIRSICHSLADGCAPNLVELCLGGNTITDSCFHHVLFAMESRQLTKLRFLGIEMNYLTTTSMEMLGRTIGKMVCPELSQISYSDNSCSDADAKRLIATAVYQERMFRMRQQQLRRQQQLSDHRQSMRHSGQHAQVDYPTSREQSAVPTYPLHHAMHQRQPYARGMEQEQSFQDQLRSIPGQGYARGGDVGGAYSSDEDDEPYSSEGE